MGNQPLPSSMNKMASFPPLQPPTACQKTLQPMTYRFYRCHTCETASHCCHHRYTGVGLLFPAVRH